VQLFPLTDVCVMLGCYTRCGLSVACNGVHYNQITQES